MISYLNGVCQQTPSAPIREYVEPVTAAEDKSIEGSKWLCERVNG